MAVWKLHVAAVFFAASITAPTALAAPILNEAAGNFSNDWLAPTVVASGTTGIMGLGMPEWMGGTRHDVFLFSGLTPGASSLVFDFALPGPVNVGAYANGE